MKSVVIQKFEHDSIRVGEAGFSATHFHALVSYNDRHKNRFFLIGHNRLTFTQFVGIIHIHNLTIEILPKIDRQCETQNHNAMSRMLVKMLQRTGCIPLEPSMPSWLNRQTGSLFELFLRLFLQEVKKLTFQGLPKHYTRHRSNEPFLKGQLLLQEQLKHNLIRKDRNFIEYKRYSIDHAFNQILKCALQIVSDISSSLQSSAADLLAHFDDVCSVAVTSAHFSKLRYNRNTECYRSAITLAQLIITGYQPDLKYGTLNITAFLFDMNLLFEKYVAAEIQQYASRNREQIKIRTQISKTFWNDECSRTRKQIRPDIIIESAHTTTILDTKWKILHNSTPDDGDLKQLYAYSLQFEANEVYLVYPASDDVCRITNTQFHASRNGQLHGTRHLTLLHIPLLDYNGNLNRNLGQEILCKIDSSNKVPSPQ